MAAFKKWPKYDGVLQEPIKFPHLAILKHRGDMERAIEEYKLHLLKNRVRKLNALFALYEIDSKSPEGCYALAYALASRHVPGFEMEDFDKLRARLARRPGRPSNKENSEYLTAEIWLVKQFCEIKERDSSLSLNDVCRLIRKKKDLPKILHRNGAPLSVRRLAEIITDRRRKGVDSVVGAILDRISKGTWPIEAPD